jgi:RNA polymerase sigma factor for flagellar operon FliA
MSSDALARDTRESRPAVTHQDYERFAPLVRRIAMRIARRVPREVTVNDLIAYGWLGLLEANGRATTSMSEEGFEAYASSRVRGAMLDHLRSLDPASRTVRAQSRTIAQAILLLTQRHGRPPEEQEVATELSMDIEAYRAALQRIGEAGMARLDVLDVEQIEATDETTDERVDRKMLVEQVAGAIDQLPERLKLVVALYYQEGCTLAQIGRVLGVTEARVCQSHADAMHRLRARMGRV